MPAIAAAGIGAAGALGGALINSSAASSAAGKQNAASYAALLANQEAQVAGGGYWNPLIGPGIDAANRANGIQNANTAALQPYQNALAPGGITDATLRATPGYQFALSQGLASTQSAAAARGLGVSGAALRGAANFATGLADTTYQNQFGDAVTGYNTVAGGLNTLFNENQAVYGQGATDTANFTNQQLAYTTGSNANLIQNGSNQASATLAGANALTSGLNGVSNAATNYNNNQLLASYLNGNSSQYADSANSNYTGSDNDGGTWV